jgi:tetratricopeptide (TPR) repeat protein
MAAKLRQRIIRYGTKPQGQPAPRGRRAGVLWGGAILAGVLLVVGILVIAQKSRSARNISRESPAVSPASRPGDAASGVSRQSATDAAQPSAASGPHAESARLYLNAGSELLLQDRLKEAVDQFRMALARNPADEDVHYNLAIALARLGNTDEAIQEYRETLRLMPDYVEAHNNLGNLLTKQGKYDEAIQHFNEALRVMPENASAHNNLGTALGRQGKLPEAITQFAEAVRLQTNYVEAHFNLANACLMMGQTERAMAEFTEVLRMRPEFVPAQQGLEKARQRRLLGPVRP